MSTTLKSWSESIFQAESLGFRLDWNGAHVEASELSTLQPKFKDAFKAMAELEEGAIANTDEERRVGHYWLRNSEIAPKPELKRKIDSLQLEIVQFVEKVHGGSVKPPNKPKFKYLLVIGIGGSALGPQLISEAFKSHDDPMEVFFLDNTDPDGFERTLTHLKPHLASTLTVVISKSGGTPETRNGMLAAQRAYEARNLNFGAHACAITGESSKLAAFADEAQFIKVFPMWDWVGGRTSIFSAVGLLPAALQGINMIEMMQGAAEMDRLTRVSTLDENPAALLAGLWYILGEGQGKRDMVVLPYRDRLSLLSRYLQQLVMESLGKQYNLNGEEVWQGIAVYGNKGSTDQHAYVQQLRDGLDNFFVTFVHVLSHGAGHDFKVEDNATAGDYLNGFLMGTREALAERGRPSLTLSFKRWDESSMGAFIALYERAVGFYASLIGVNAYHQPGVEAGKKAAANVLNLQQRCLDTLANASKPLTAIEIAAQLDETSREADVFQILEYLAMNPERGVVMGKGQDARERTFSLKT